MFHYLHRPEVLKAKKSATEDDGTKTTCCCIVRLQSEIDAKTFIQRYDKKQWTDREGQLMDQACYIRKIKDPVTQGRSSAMPIDLTESNLEADQSLVKKYLTRKQKKMLHRVSTVDGLRNFASLPEFNPPILLPQGNVGTPLEFIQQKVRECVFPSSLLKKLGINALRRRRYRQYGEVRYDYSGEDRNMMEEEGVWSYEARPTGDELTGWEGEDRNVGYADQDAEDWERHEALREEEHEEQLFEKEVELVWEKGGSGLVFWTDGVYWDAQNEKEDIDDFDVDTEYYYNERGGDDDALYGSEQNRNPKPPIVLERIVNEEGQQPSKGPQNPRDRKRAYDTNYYRKMRGGLIVKMMKRWGWSEGQGIGSTPGRAEPIELQTQSDTTGLGFAPEKKKKKGKGRKPSRYQDDGVYYGERVRRPTRVSQWIQDPSRKQQLVDSEKVREKDIRDNPEYITIATVYDNPKTNPLLQLVAAYADASPDTQATTTLDTTTTTTMAMDTTTTMMMPGATTSRSRRTFDDVVLMPSLKFVSFVPGGTVQQEREDIIRSGFV